MQHRTLLAASRAFVSRGALKLGTHLVGALAPALALAFVVPAAQATNKVMFVTSVSGTGDLSTWSNTLGHTGLEAADAVCQARAHAVGLDGGGRIYRAWLSDSKDDAFCRVRTATGHGQRATRCGGIDPLLFLFTGGPWLRTDGYPFSENEYLLTSEMPLMPPRIDEFGKPVLGDIWTGTLRDGTATLQNCGSWNSAIASAEGGVGAVDGTALWWTEAPTDVPETLCSNSYHLLCFETGTDGSPLPSFEKPGALAFVTSATGTGDLSTWPGAVGSGLAAGDSICRAAARAGHLPSPDAFVAWLSAPGIFPLFLPIDAIDRLTIEGPWKLLNGVRVAASKQQLASGELAAPIAQTELGSTQASTYVAWTGTTAAGSRGSQTCAGWTDGSTTETGMLGIVGVSADWWTEWQDLVCEGPDPDFTGALYCFSNVVSIFWDGFESGSTSRWSNAPP